MTTGVSPFVLSVENATTDRRLLSPFQFISLEHEAFPVEVTLATQYFLPDGEFYPLSSALFSSRRRHLLEG